MTALRTLIEAVERGEPWPMGHKADARVNDPKSLMENWSKAAAAYHGSVDAALALMEAVLPGWSWEVGTTSGRPSAAVWGQNIAVVSSGNTPARALLLAILKAMEAQTAGKE